MLRNPILVLASLCACGSTPDEVVCRQGFTAADDGHCYPPLEEDPPADFERVLAELPECEPLDNPGRIDLSTGCAAFACVGMTANEIDVVLHEEPDCTTASWADDQLYCTWPRGLQGLFFDGDEDGVPDDDAGTDRIRVFPPFAEATADGLGVGVNTRCFVEALGQPTEVVLVDIAGELRIEDLIYDQYGLSAYDWGSDDDSDRPNGYLDNLYLWGPPAE